MNEPSLRKEPEMNNIKKRTQADLMQDVLDMIDPAISARFEKELLPQMRLSNSAQQEIGEEEYQFLLQQFRREMPHFLQYLRTTAAAG